jgi:CheY-like chemotaxis protein
MTESVYRILVVDDEEEAANQLAEVLSEDLSDLGQIHATPCSSFSDAEVNLESGAFDIVVLDVAEQSPDGKVADGERGRTVYERISTLCWLPVVFYTGYPARVEELVGAGVLVQAVAKGNLREVTEAVRNALLSDVPTLTRGITTFVGTAVRGFLRDHIAGVWDELQQADREELPFVLLNRLAAQLKDDAVRALDEIIGARSGNTVPAGAAARVYLYPPITMYVTSGDLLKAPNGDRWLVTTPACDLYADPPVPRAAPGRGRRTPKADYVRLARAHELLEFPPVSALLAMTTPDKTTRDKVRGILSGDRDRFVLLPHYLQVPDLIVDLENMLSEPLKDVQCWIRQATLDSPYVESVLAQNARFSSRIGVPDLPKKRLWNKVEEELQKRSESARD